MHKFLPFAVVVLLSIFSVLPFFNNGFISMHDNTQVERVSEMANSLKDGMFPVRWVENLGFGYGYPIFNFYGPFPYYFASFFTIFFNPLIATKIMIISAIVFSGIFMYFLGKEFWGREGGILSALLFVYAPYHAVNVYVRGAIGELWAYAFLPLIFYGIWKTHKEKKWKYVVFGALGFAALIASHNLSAFMVTPFLLFLLIFLFFFSNSKQKIYLSSLFILGILISGFYWFPAVLEMEYTNVRSQVGGGADFRDHYVCLSQLWNSPWGFGGSAKGCLDGLSFKVGKIHIALSIFSLLSALTIFVVRKKSTTSTIAVTLAFFGLIVSVLLTLPFSEIIWEAISPMEFIQYPWRYITFISFFTSFIAGYSMFLFKKIKVVKNYSFFALFLFVLSILFLYSKLFTPQLFIDKRVDYFTDKTHIAWDTSKISSEYMPVGFIKPNSKLEVKSSKLEIIKGSGKINILESKTDYIFAKVQAEENISIRANIAYFPAWKLYVDDDQVEYRKTNQGLDFNMEKGNHVIILKFEQTPIEQIGNLLSISGLLILITGIIYPIRNRKR